VLVAGVVGCGSGSKSSTTAESTATVSSEPGSSATGTFVLANVRKCLNREGLTATPNTHNRVVSGTGGELRVDFGYGTDWIYIAFGKDAAEAKAIQERAVAAAELHEQLGRKLILAGVEQTGNVFYYADGGPLTAVERTKIDACLR
jgi:hypothetical protein